MNEKKPLHFTGDGFSQEEFTPEDRAKMRERHHFIDRHFLQPEEFLQETGLSWFSRMARGFPAFVKMFAVISIIGAGVMAAKQLGIF